MKAIGALFLLCAVAIADEGMWPFNAVPKQVLQQRYGFTPSDAWLNHLQLSSVRFNNGGSGSFVGRNGLVMTNHHVASECIHELSSAGKDYMAEGYYAESAAKEAKCPSLELNVLQSIADVTNEVNAAVKPGMDNAARNTAQRGAMARIEKECADKTRLRCDVVTLYEGGAFNLYRYKKYTDVRLVFAPEADAAFFGGDPDNFTYPRYDLDVSFFRVYENGKPAQIEHFLKWSAGGAKDGELVFISGHPGGTGRLLAMTQMEFLRDVAYPIRLNWLVRRLATLRNYTTRGPEDARIARDVIFSYENSYKAIAGYQSGLLDPSIMNKRRQDEEALRTKVSADPKMEKEFGGTWDSLAQAQRTYADFYRGHQMLEQSFGLRQSTLFQIARHLVRLPVEKQKANEQRLREYRESNLPSIEDELYSTAPIYASLETVMLAELLGEMQESLGANHPVVRQALGGRLPVQAAEQYIKTSKLADVETRKKLAAGGTAAVEASDDGMIRLARIVDQEARSLRKRYEDQVEGIERRAGSQLAKAIFAVKGTNTYPDATFTLRLSFGPVKGYTEGGKKVPYTTTFQGLYERATGIEPYKIPQRWVAAKSKLRLDTPFNFVSTGDIIGGNSGSPVVNRNNELVGIIFDGNIQSLPNRFLYTDEIARAVSVHSAGIIEALDKVYNARGLVNELRGGGGATSAGR